MQFLEENMDHLEINGNADGSIEVITQLPQPLAYCE